MNFKNSISHDNNQDQLHTGCIVSKYFISRKSISPTDERWQITLEYCKHEFILAMICVATFCSCSIFGMTSNLFFYVNDYRLPVRLFITFMQDDETSFNWSINYGSQLIAAASLALFLYPYFPITLVVINHTCLKVDAAVLAVDDLNRVLKIKSTGQNKTFNQSVARELEKIILATRDVQTWQSEVQYLMRFNFLGEFSILSFLICLCIYTLSTNLFGSILILMTLSVAFFQFFVYCLMGSRVKTRFEKLSDSLYAIDWYLMDAKHQKDLQLIILRTQRMTGFNGIFRDVSLQTFQKVSYSG